MMTNSGDAAEALRTGLSRAAAKIPWFGPRLAVRLHRHGLGTPARSWAEVADLVMAKRPDALSVDVFDTCVVRELLGDRPIEVAIDAVMGARLDHPVAISTLDREVVAAELESVLCRPIPGVIEALDRVRKVGVEVTFLSDTQRSSADLRQLLTDLGIFRHGDSLIASCEAGATKSNGDLFVGTWHESSRAGDVWHVGNNLWSDVTMAEQAGLVAVPIVVAEPTRYETAMAARPNTAGPAIAAAARTTRLAIEFEHPEPDSRPARLETLGAEVAGQSLGAFVLWVAERARAEGLPHLAFLSRDGELPLEMAKAMPDDHWEGVSFSYLHCSRWSWVLAGAATHGIETWLEVGTRDDKAFIHANRHRVPFRSVLGRIGLQPDDVREHADLAALRPGEPMPEELGDAWVQLLADPDVQQRILTRATERKDLLVAYLREVGLPPGRIGLVDVGWRGRLAWAMSPIVAEATGFAPLHLHVGGDKILPDVDEKTDIERFAFDGTSVPRRIANPVSCIETITASGRARVVDYERDETGRVQPVFEREVAEIRNADRRHLWAGAVRAAANMPPRSMLVELGVGDESLAAEAVAVLAHWWNEPLREEAEAMSGLAFEADDDGRSIKPVVTPYTAREMGPDGRLPRIWQEGSAAVSGRGFGTILGAYKIVRTRLKGRSEH